MGYVIRIIVRILKYIGNIPMHPKIMTAPFHDRSRYIKYNNKHCKYNYVVFRFHYSIRIDNSICMNTYQITPFAPIVSFKEINITDNESDIFTRCIEECALIFSFYGGFDDVCERIWARIPCGRSFWYVGYV